MRTTFRHAPLAVGALTLFAAGAVSTPALAQAKWTNYIDASMINDIVERDGVLYMATFGGLLLYDVADGEFEQFNNVDGLPSNSLRCLVFEDDGDLYIGSTDLGVAKVRFSGGAPVVVRSLNEQIDGLSSNAINSVVTWGADILYGANPGVGIIRNDFAAARYFERDGLPDDDVKDVLADGDYAWIATNAGVAILDRLGFIRRPTGAPTVANVLGSDGAHVWIGTDDGAWRFDPSDSSWTDVGPDARVMHSLYWDGTTMWGGSTRNLCRYTGTGQVWDQFATGGVVANYEFDAGGSVNQIRGMATGSDGDLYLGSVQPNEVRGANLIRFDGTPTMANLIPNAPGGTNILRLSVDVDGSLWAVFPEYYVGKVTPSGTWVNYNPAVSDIEVPSKGLFNLALLADSQGFKWFCDLPSPTLDQLDDRQDAIYTNDVWTRHAVDSGGGDGLGTLFLQRGLEDPAGNRWFLSNDAGIQILSRDGSEWFEMSPTKDPRMIDDDVVDVAFGDFSAYVAYRNLGVQLWFLGGYSWNEITNTTGDAWNTPIASTSLPSGAVMYAIALRSDNVLWVASDKGLFRYTPSNPPERRLETVPVYAGIGAGILSPKVQDILLDHDENLWVASDQGLNQIARDDYADIETYTSLVTYVTLLADLRYPLSIISPLSNGDCRSLAMHPTRDILYIGTLAGVSVLDYAPPPPTDTDLSKVYLYPNPVYRSRGQNELKIENISGPVSIEVYNLEGVLVHSQTVDSNGQVAWDLTTRTGVVTGSGNYLVRVVGANGSVTKTIAVLR